MLSKNRKGNSQIVADGIADDRYDPDKIISLFFKALATTGTKGGGKWQVEVMIMVSVSILNSRHSAAWQQ